MDKKRNGSDTQLALALARGVKVSEVAKTVGMSERTAYRRLADPSFKEFVNDIRASLLGETVSRLVADGLKATETLRELCDAESEQVRLGAAKSILELSSRLQEKVEFEQRLSAMEKEVSNRGMGVPR